MPLTLSNSPAVNAVIEQFSSFHPLSDELIQDFSDNSFEISLKKNEYLMRKGELSTHVYFVLKGVVCGQVSNEKETVTSFITVDGEFLSAIEGMYGDKPCVEDVKAEEDSHLLAMCSTYFHGLYDRYPEMNALFRKILELYYTQAHYRSIFIRMGSLADKYAYFLKAFPDHVERIPLSVAASFLNLKDATLQKMINKTKDQKVLDQQLSRESMLISMEVFEPYLQKKLTLQQLASHFKIKPHELSYLLNEYFSENFNSFINRYRINYVLKHFADQVNMGQYSMEGVGRHAGFSSKSTFFTEFKKRVGASPQIYFQKQKV
ncbi:helix-turn-helix domain-containing protein [Pedobacter hiemivivus]|uniref:Helix-turn-helix domain-containing protein n=1 Tax=Pedobacter hiemivivus TaxID=2530454 RepID=A0A4U1G2A1_9SPHI|nr:Crp/Fnr family transcriptional regulator [Pedobacter hiemivivus]TKC56929.1 helix-turn-helix domain-containing protein [Pedobacter hiemivivus]